MTEPDGHIARKLVLPVLGRLVHQYKDSLFRIVRKHSPSMARYAFDVAFVNLIMSKVTVPLNITRPC